MACAVAAAALSSSAMEWLLKPTAWVRSPGINRFARAEIMPLSMPPERNAATGTSAMDCSPIALSMHARRDEIAADSTAVEIALGKCQYRRGATERRLVATLASIQQHDPDGNDRIALWMVSGSWGAP